MNAYRSGRAWLPATVVSVVFTLTLVILQVVFRVAYDDSYASANPEDSTLEWLFVSNLGFWGPGVFETDSSRVVVGSLLAGVALLVVAFLIAWIALRGAAPGSSAFTGFLGCWAATMVAAPVASVTMVLVRYYDELREVPLGPQISAAVSTSVYGFKWGWAAALIATLVWVAVRPRPGDATQPAPAPATTPAHLAEPDSSQPSEPPTTSEYPDSRA